MTESSDSVGEKIRDSAASLVHTLGEGTMMLVATVSESAIALGYKNGSNALVISRLLDDCHHLVKAELHYGAVTMPGEYYQPNPNDKLLERHCPERLIARFKLLIDALLIDAENGLEMSEQICSEVRFIFSRIKLMTKPGELELDERQSRLITTICGIQT